MVSNQRNFPLSKLVENIDLRLAYFIRSNIKPTLMNKVLSKVNRGETMGLFFLPFVFYAHPWKEALFILIFTSVITYCNDRLVLFIKKITSRKRPLIKVLEKDDSNPDMKHSFPSAHAANSMAFLTIMVLGFHYPPYIIVLSFLAGIGRLITLHHFLSDVLSGWILGFSIGFVACLAILPQVKGIL